MVELPAQFHTMTVFQRIAQDVDISAAPSPQKNLVAVINEVNLVVRLALLGRLRIYGSDLHMEQSIHQFAGRDPVFQFFQGQDLHKRSLPVEFSDAVLQYVAWMSLECHGESNNIVKPPSPGLKRRIVPMTRRNAKTSLMIFQRPGPAILGRCLEFSVTFTR